LDKDLTANPEILWSQSTVRTVLGFEEDSPTRPTTTLYTNIQTDEHNSSLVAPNPAKFNSYNSFVLHSDLVSEGIQINNTYDNIISQIQITANVGEIENFRANDKNVFSIVNNLIGSQNQRYRARFSLTSELGIPLDTKGENYDFVILLSWLEH
jgi:pectin methylesterase-like acyl-CoA thioesterase